MLTGLSLSLAIANTMIKYMTPAEQRAFWAKHDVAHRSLGERLANLPYAEKLEIMNKMEANHDAMRNARVIKRFA